MHVEKNMCDNLIAMLLNIKGKTKDGLNTRIFFVKMGIREQLQLMSQGQQTYLPQACHTLSIKEKTSFCEYL